jgi:hypothetical protein
MKSSKDHIATNITVKSPISTHGPKTPTLRAPIILTPHAIQLEKLDLTRLISLTGSWLSQPKYPA